MCEGEREREKERAVNARQYGRGKERVNGSLSITPYTRGKCEQWAVCKREIGKLETPDYCSFMCEWQQQLLSFFLLNFLARPRTVK